MSVDLLYNIISFLFVISIIVFVHEYGHYIIAKYFGVKIEVFSIGFGKEIYSWIDKSDTKWQICYIPIGGYVRMHGDQNASSTNYSIDDNIDKKSAFYTKSLFAKSIIVAAGPIFNFILSILIFTSLLSVVGRSVALPTIDSVQENSIAELSGIIIGDKILSIDGIKINYFSDIERVISTSNGKELEFIIERDSEIIEKSVKPKLTETEDIFGNIIKKPKIGIISKQFTNIKYSIGESFLLSVKDSYTICFLTIKSIYKMITGNIKTAEIGGPISIAKYSGQSAKGGFASLLFFIALLSINIGLMNLLPIPVLDGGHILFYIIEGIIRRPISEIFKNYSFKIGTVLLFLLMIFSTFNDIKKIFTN